MSLQYVIDGYNLIHNDNFRDSPGKNTDCRISLLEFIRLNKLNGSSNNQVITVFDGYPPYSPFLYEHKNFKVIFSCDISADQKIKNILEESVNKKNIIVVSDDKEIIFFARQCRAQVEGAGNFLSKAKKDENQLKNPGSGLSYTQAHDINEELRKKWLK
ncbi:MAG: NYN domain-containing protein [Candidatus Omnitrophica bacterium]|nr:NYN domain-containing protein [Candidatus Omnitrophota bacterium]